jgi:hypothetical protein
MGRIFVKYVCIHGNGRDQFIYGFDGKESYMFKKG